MKEGSRIYNIFKKGSKTYFYNSLFFPKDVRDDVFILYSFVREADNLVDAIPQKKEDFCTFQDHFCSAWDGDPSGDEVLDGFVDLAKEKKFEKAWIESFLHSMELDLTKSTYDDLDEVLEYIYGSAEVVGLMMARLLDVDPSYHDNARALGRAMQYINFIRDIDEDNKLGRRYLPTDELRSFGLKNLEYDHVRSRKEDFKAFISKQVDRYREWQKEAEKGYKGLKKEHLPPVMNAAEMYDWTANTILKDPLVVYRRKVKPSKARIISNLMGKRLHLQKAQTTS